MHAFQPDGEVRPAVAVDVAGEPAAVEAEGAALAVEGLADQPAERLVAGGLAVGVDRPEVDAVGAALEVEDRVAPGAAAGLADAREDERVGAVTWVTWVSVRCVFVAGSQTS